MKYIILENESRNINGHIVHPIIAVQTFRRKNDRLYDDEDIRTPDEARMNMREFAREYYIYAGMIGGWVETEDNLSKEGGCWIERGAAVYGNARVCDFGQVRDTAQVYGNARVCDCGEVCGAAQVYGNAIVRNYGKIYGTAQVYGNAEVAFGKVYGNARVYGEANIGYNAIICDNAQIYGNAWVSGLVANDAKVYGNAHIDDTVWDMPCICGQAEVFDNAKIGGKAIVFGKVGGAATIKGDAWVDIDDGIIAGDTVVESRTLGTSLAIMLILIPIAKIICWIRRREPSDIIRFWNNL